MPIQIDMDMPEMCTECKYGDSANELGRIRCRLTNHEFPTCEGHMRRFPTCPLKEVK